MNYLKYAQISYFIPIVFLLLHLIDAVAFRIAGFLFPFTIGTSVPCGIAGLAFSIRGIAFWKSRRHNQKVDFGIALIWLGIFIVTLGLLFYGIMYLMMN